MDTSHPVTIVLWAFAILTYGITLFPNYGFTEGLRVFGVNISKTSIVAQKFVVDIQPASSMFFLWTLIFIWQIAWLAYTSTLIFRQSREGHLYYSPPFITNYVYGFFILASVLDFLWNILWGLQYVQFCLLVNVLLLLSLSVSLASCFCGLREHGQDLINQGKTKDVYCVVLLVQYGLGLYLWQVYVSTIVNFSGVLTYYGNVSNPTSGAVSLSVLLVTMTTWFMFDNFFAEKCCRYFFVPYIVVIYFLAESLRNNWEVYSREPSIDSKFTSILLALVCIAFIVKIVLVFVRSRKQPLFDWQGNYLELDTVESENAPLVQNQ